MHCPLFYTTQLHMLFYGSTDQRNNIQLSVSMCTILMDISKKTKFQRFVATSGLISSLYSLNFLNPKATTFNYLRFPKVETSLFSLSFEVVPKLSQIINFQLRQNVLTNIFHFFHFIHSFSFNVAMPGIPREEQIGTEAQIRAGPKTYT